MIEKLISIFFDKKTTNNFKTVITENREIKTACVFRRQAVKKDYEDNLLKGYFIGLKGLKNRESCSVNSLYNRQSHERFDGS